MGPCAPYYHVARFSNDGLPNDPMADAAERETERVASRGMLAILADGEAWELGRRLASATAECSGRQSGRLYTGTAASRVTYGAMADEIRALRDLAFGTP